MPFAFLGISQAGLLCHTVGQTEYEFVTKIAVQSSAQCSITKNCGGTDRPQGCVVAKPENQPGLSIVRQNYLPVFL
jgi:hypothetical protein